MPIQATTVATSIAALSPIDTDIIVLDLNKVKDKVTNRSKLLLMPASNFFSAPVLGPKSLGTGSTAQFNLIYILTYRFFYKPVAAARKRSEIMRDFVGKTTAIIDTIILNDTVTGAIDIRVVSVGAFDRVMDPSDTITFWGTDIGIQVTEFIN